MRIEEANIRYPRIQNTHLPQRKYPGNLQNTTVLTPTLILWITLQSVLRRDPTAIKSCDILPILEMFSLRYTISGIRLPNQEMLS